MDKPILNPGPGLWAQFAAAALAAIIERNRQNRAVSSQYAEAADDAATYADAMSREYEKRFYKEVR